MVLGALLALAGRPAAAETAAPNPADVVCSSWQGWGCSLAWWAVATEGWTEGRRAELCRRIFGSASDCLGLTICRYNAGGTAPETDAKLFRPGGAVRVVLDKDGTWHPDRDRGQIACLRLARKLGATHLELFVNSPPWWMLTSGDTRGGPNGGDNLPAGREVEYAAWVASTLRHFAKDEGIRFDSVAPFNEPSSGWWDPAKQSQEGCHIGPAQQVRVLRALRASLRSDLSSVKIVASDENGSQEGYAALDEITKPGATSGAPLLDRLDVHAYAGWDWQERLAALARDRGVRSVWMSEVTYRESGIAGFVPQEMRSALPVTRSVASDIRLLRPQAWVYWQPAEPLQFCIWYHYTYGLLPTAFDKEVQWEGRTYQPGEYVVTKAFHALRQFSAAIRPGAKLIASGDPWTVAALAPDGRTLILVVHNDDATAKRYQFELARVSGASDVVRATRTSENAGAMAWDERALPPRRAVAGLLEETIPPHSVTTYSVDVRR